MSHWRDFNSAFSLWINSARLLLFQANLLIIWFTEDKCVCPVHQKLQNYSTSGRNKKKIVQYLHKLCILKEEIPLQTFSSHLLYHRWTACCMVCLSKFYGKMFSFCFRSDENLRENREFLLFVLLCWLNHWLCWFYFPSLTFRGNFDFPFL